MSLDNETDSSEEIFFKIKKEIIETSKEIETSISKIYAQEEILKAKKHIDFFNYNYEWLYSKFKKFRIIKFYFFKRGRNKLHYL